MTDKGFLKISRQIGEAIKIGDTTIYLEGFHHGYKEFTFSILAPKDARIDRITGEDYRDLISAHLANKHGR